MNESILELLKTLHYHGMINNFQDIIKTAEGNNESWQQILQRLLKVEIEYRKTRSLMYRLNLAKLPQIKTLENFDIESSALDGKILTELSECNYINDAMNIFLIGGSGSGKSHIALSLAYIALQHGYKVKFFKFTDLARKLLVAKDQHYEANLMIHLQRFHLIIIDELGYLPIDKQAGILLFELFSNLYEKVPLIITTHLSFNEWNEIFDHPKATKAMIDRLTHHCKILETGNSSWRLKESAKQKQ
jgi:DNA replication protein DnaC